LYKSSSKTHVDGRYFGREGKYTPRESRGKKKTEAFLIFLFKSRIHKKRRWVGKTLLGRGGDWGARHHSSTKKKEWCLRLQGQSNVQEALGGHGNRRRPTIARVGRKGGTMSHVQHGRKKRPLVHVDQRRGERQHSQRQRPRQKNSRSRVS